MFNMNINRAVINAKIYAFILYQFLNLVLGTFLMPFTMGYFWLSRKMDGEMISLIVRTSYLAAFRMLELSIWATGALYFPSFEEFTKWQQWKQWEITDAITKSYRTSH